MEPLREYVLTKSKAYYSSLSSKNREKERGGRGSLNSSPPNGTKTLEQNAQTVQAICTWFKSWQAWQQRILFNGLINRLTKSQLRSVSMAVESVFHRDFIASYKEVYPMRKVKTSQNFTSAANSMSTTFQASTSPDKLSRYEGEAKNLTEEPTAVSQVSISPKQNISIGVSPLPQAVSQQIDISINQGHQGLDQTSASSRNLSPINEQDDASPQETVRLATAKSTLGAHAVDTHEGKAITSMSIGSAHSVAPSLSPIEETSPEILPQTEEKLKSNAKTPVSNSAPSKTKLTHNQQKTNKYQDQISRPDSTTSLWTMGPADSVNDEKEIDYQSRITPLDVEPGDFFDCDSKQQHLGGHMTSRSRAGSQFLQRLDHERNKIPFPTSTQLYKPSKLWSSEKAQIAANANKLKEGFRQQLSQIWDWARDWQEHIYVRLIIQLFEYSDGSFEKYVADCIKGRINEANLGQMNSQLLPDQFWVNVFEYLTLIELLTAGLVCKRWYSLTNSDTLWKNKCEEIGKMYSIPHLTKLIEQTAAHNETLDWRQAYIELHQRFHFNADKIAAAVPKAQPVGPKEETKSSVENDTALNLAEKYKGYTSYSKLKGKTATTKKKFHPLKQRYGRYLEEVDHPEATDTVEAINNIKPVSTSISPPKDPPTGGGFLEMWKNIKEELPTTDFESESRRSDRCFDVDVYDELFTEEEAERMSKRNELFCVDYRLPQENQNRFWLVNSIILPVRRVQILEAHRGPVTCVMCKGKRIFSGGLDRRIRIWSDTGECFLKMDDCLKGSVLGISVMASTKCRKVFSASWDTSVSVWDSVTGKRIKSLNDHTDTVSAVAVDTKYIVSCSHDGTIRVWDVITYQCVRVLDHHDGAVHCLSYEDALIITGGADKLVFVSDPDTGCVLKTFQGHTSPINAIQRQRNLVVTGDLGGDVFFWSLSGDEGPMEFVQAHEKQINQIAFHGGRFFTASNDKTIKEWELMTMTCVRVMQGHMAPVTGVQFTDRYLVSCSKDGTIRLWWWGSDDDDEKKE